MKNTTKWGLFTLTLAVAISTPVFAQSKGGKQGQQKGNGPDFSMVERVRGNPANCDGTGLGQGTPLQDGSGKAVKGKGNPNGNGTPLRDGSGYGNGGKGNGRGADGTCPNS